MGFLTNEQIADWQKTRRTHEECANCPHEFIMPRQCPGHESGENPCYYKRSLNNKDNQAPQ